MRNSSLSIRFSIYVFIFLAFLGLIISGINFKSAKETAGLDLETELAHLKSSHMISIVKALWVMDFDEVSRQLEVISDFNYVDFIKLYDVDGSNFEAGHLAVGQDLIHRESLFYEFNNENMLIGEIRIFYDKSKIIKYAAKDAFKLYLMLLLSDLIISIIIYLLFKILVGDYVKNLSEFLQHDSVGQLSEAFKFDRKNQSNDELSTLTFSINEMRTSLEKEIKFRDKIYAIISHDLRAPLASYNSLVEMMLENSSDHLTEDDQIILREMYKSSGALSMLVQNLLDWARFEKGATNFNPEQLNIGALPEKIASLYRRIATDKGIDLVTSSTGSIYAYADLNMVETVLRNLISNSIKFTSKGGRVELSAEFVENKPVLKVADNGTGIPADTLVKLNNDEVVNSRRGTASEKGTGLGLLLCKEMARANAAELEFESMPGEGTTVRLILPSGSS